MVETPVSEHHEEEQYHDASQHGWAWATLNELLHVIVFLYTIFGWLQFRSKFIRAYVLVKLASKLIIAYNTYLSIKFGLLAGLMIAHANKLAKYSLTIESLNCSLMSYTQLVPDGAAATAARNAQELALREASREMSARRSPVWGPLLQSAGYIESLFHSDHLQQLSLALNSYGGPYKYLGSTAALIYGVFSIGVYIQLVIFPLEQTLGSRQVGFNFIRFVLSDAQCMRDMYARLKFHLRRLAAWSRTRSDSVVTRSLLKLLRHRNLRVAGTLPGSVVHARSRTESRSECVGPRVDGAGAAVAGKPPNARSGSRRAQDEGQQTTTIVGESRSNSSQAKGHEPGGRKPAVPLRQLATRTALNLSEEPDYRVKVANRNLRRFKPFVRSENWFKASMIIFPTFILVYFGAFVVFLSRIQAFLSSERGELLAECRKSQLWMCHNTPGSSLSVDSGTLDGATGTAYCTQDSLDLWSTWDWITYFEHLYIIFSGSVGVCFFCSYFFSTILGLSVWLSEITQQLSVCVRVLELSEDIKDPEPAGGCHSFEIRTRLTEWAKSSGVPVEKYVNEFGGKSELFPSWKGRRESEFGSYRRRRGPSKAKMTELMAIKLLDKKETLVRATYVNICLFFDELEDTRYMISTILKRATEQAAGFAALVALTRSQFEVAYWTVNLMLIATFLIFNIILFSGAYINSRVNHTMAHIHSAICAHVKSGSHDSVMLEFFVRHERASNPNDMAYNIYGYRLTYAAILRMSSFIMTVFFITLE